MVPPFTGPGGRDDSASKSVVVAGKSPANCKIRCSVSTLHDLDQPTLRPQIEHRGGRRRPATRPHSSWMWPQSTTLRRSPPRSPAATAALPSPLSTCPFGGECDSSTAPSGHDCELRLRLLLRQVEAPIPGRRRDARAEAEEGDPLELDGLAVQHRGPAAARRAERPRRSRCCRAPPRTGARSPTARPWSPRARCEHWRSRRRRARRRPAPSGRTSSRAVRTVAVQVAEGEASHVVPN